MRALASKHDGSALVLVLWLVIVMTLVATVTAKISRLDGTVSQLSVERIRCRWAARAGLETAIALLLTDETPTDALTDLWSQNPAELEAVPLESATFTVAVTDEAGRLHLNYVTENQLAMLADMTQEISDSLLDWRDSDQETRAYGAEAGYYLNQPSGYICRDGQFQTVRELLLVRGVDEDLVYGRDGMTPLGFTPWIELMTCHSAVSNTDLEGTAKININSANRNSLRNDLSLSNDQAQWIESHRQFQSYSELMDANKQATSSNNNQARGGQTGATGTTNNQSQATGQTSTRTSSQPNTNSGGTAARTNNQTSSTGNNRNNNSGNTAAGSNRNTGNTTGGNTGNQRTTGTNQSTGNNQNNTANNQNQGTPPDLAAVLRMADQITFDSQPFAYGRININTASLEVLEALLGGRRDLAESILSARLAKEGGFTSFEDLRQVQGMTDEVLSSALDSMTLSSSVFRIVSDGVSDATGQTVRIEAIVNRAEENGRVLYWREE